MRSQRGFTLVELMITILIAAILMAVAVPGFKTLSQNSHQRNAVNDVQVMLARVRTEVAARRQGVTACPSADQATCSGAVTWETGWIIFVDRNLDGVVDADDDSIIQVHQALPAGVTLRSMGDDAATRVTFDSTGLPIEETGTTFRYCDERGITSLRAVIVGPSGMVRSALDGKDQEGNEIAACT
jgi:type IV fimbrial biogenesis protein FimT